MKKINPLPFLFASIFYVASLTLFFLKCFFGYPYLIEGFMILGIAIIMSYIAIINLKLDAVIESFTGIMKDFTKVLDKAAQIPNPFMGMNMPEGINVKTIEIKQDENGNISTNASPEDLSFINKQAPLPIKELFNSIFKKEEKSIDKMSDKKLAEELQKAIDKENFERANTIKKEQEKRTKL